MNSENEKTLYTTQLPLYTELAKTCLESRIGVDMFIFNSEYYDLSTISAL